MFDFSIKMPISFSISSNKFIYYPLLIGTSLFILGGMVYGSTNLYSKYADKSPESVAKYLGKSVPEEQDDSDEPESTDAVVSDQKDEEPETTGDKSIDDKEVEVEEVEDKEGSD